ncbi:hypothetical protein sce2302 [Sorangium cellulosum So ce56]|uniref:EfeO-type cupredoxin-like domain-containing protein n=1 Tax=Sorangium cellulosum (strain So ce56) TaxID=448385 RepID=A9G115_SORC5|nr:hypothetical protein sce2302 [Sorangium cellulosum So ce56]
MLELRLVRHDSGDCTKEVVFPSLGIRKELPTGQPVTIDLPELKAGELRFECGMGDDQGHHRRRAEEVSSRGKRSLAHRERALRLEDRSTGEHGTST